MVAPHVRGPHVHKDSSTSLAEVTAVAGRATVTTSKGRSTESTKWEDDGEPSDEVHPFYLKPGKVPMDRHPRDAEADNQGCEYNSVAFVTRKT